MIITCPNCETRYTLEASALGPQGRKVRCANCRHTWQAYPDQAEAAQPSAPSADDDFYPQPRDRTRSETAAAQGASTFQSKHSVVRPIAPLPPRQDESFDEHYATRSSSGGNDEPVLSNWAIISWILLAIGVIFLAIMIIARNDISAAYPPIQSGYKAIGLDVHQDQPVTLLRLDTLPRNSGLYIEGELLNETDRIIYLQPIRIIVKDDGGTALTNLDISIEGDELGAREAKIFSAQVKNLPDEASIISAEVRYDRQRQP